MIMVDIEVFTEIVDEIKTQTESIIGTESGYVTPDPECTRNSIIPDYEQADHEVNDMLRLMKSELKRVTGVMEEIKADYERIDKEKSADIEFVFTPMRM